SRKERMPAEHQAASSLPAWRAVTSLRSTLTVRSPRLRPESAAGFCPDDLVSLRRKLAIEHLTRLPPAACTRHTIRWSNPECHRCERRLHARSDRSLRDPG